MKNILFILIFTTSHALFCQHTNTNLELGDTFSLNLNTGPYIDITKVDNIQNTRVYALSNPNETRWQKGTYFRIQIYFNKNDSIIIGIIASVAVERNEIGTKNEFINLLNFYRDEYCNNGMPGAKFVKENVNFNDGEHTDFFSYSINYNKIMKTIILQKRRGDYSFFYEEIYLINSKYKPNKTLRK